MHSLFDISKGTKMKERRRKSSVHPGKTTQREKNVENGDYEEIPVIGWALLQSVIGTLERITVEKGKTHLFCLLSTVFVTRS